MNNRRGDCSTGETIANLLLIGCAIVLVLVVALVLLVVVGVVVGAV